MTFVPPERFNMTDYFLGDRLREGYGDRVGLRTDNGDLTYADVDRLAGRFGHALRQLGVRQEDRAVVALPDCPAFAGALFGALKLGAVAVMVNPGLPQEQLAATITAARCPVVVVTADDAPRFEAAVIDARWPARILIGDGDSPEHPTVDRLNPPTQLDTVPTHRHDPAIWLFSGGTTGRPKIVVQTHQAFANTCERYAKETMGYRPDDVTLSVPKLYFGYATGSNLLFPFAVGASAVLFREPPTPDALFDRIRLHRPTILVNAPKLVGEMVDHPDAATQDLSCIRFATSAGEALPPALWERWTETFEVPLCDGLGTAEMWHIFVTNTPEDTRPGSLGRPVPGFDVRVRDDDGRDVAPGDVGRLWVRGQSRAIWYWQDLEQTAEAFQGEWFVGGDMVRADTDGYLWYVGRADDALKVSGKWVLPSEVEGILRGHPAVAECAVVGVPDSKGLTKPVAFVVAAPGEWPDLEAAVKEHALAQLEAHKHPRRVLITDDLPRTHLGKVNRTLLREQAARILLE